MAAVKVKRSKPVLPKKKRQQGRHGGIFVRSCARCAGDHPYGACPALSEVENQKVLGR